MKASQVLNDAGVFDGVLMWITVAIIIVIMIPIFQGLFQSMPMVVTNSLDVANTTNGTFGGKAVLGSAFMNTTQQTLINMTGSSMGVLIVVLIIMAAVVILGVVAYLRGGKQK
jgi:hypothetical protein